LVQRGVGITVVQQLCGHKTLEITLRYAHLAPSNVEDAIQKLEEDHAAAR
jgi:site-specific recombinase XerD